MTSASVGFHCPQCIAAGQAATRQPATAVGGRLPVGDRVTMSLIGINVVVFLLGFVLERTGSIDLVREFGMWPLGIALQGEWWRLFTSAFLHGGLLHIGFNMYVLYVLGPPLERVLGHGRFLILYLLAALGGSVASYIFSPLNVLSVGASGAIFGLLAAILVVGHRLRRDVRNVAALLAINVAIGFVVPGIDWRAHFGGAIVGAAIAAVFAYAPKANRVLWQSLGVLGITLLLVIATMVRTADISQSVPVMSLMGA